MHFYKQSHSDIKNLSFSLKSDYYRSVATNILLKKKLIYLPSSFISLVTCTINLHLVLTNYSEKLEAIITLKSFSLKITFKNNYNLMSCNYFNCKYFIYFYCTKTVVKQQIHVRKNSVCIKICYTHNNKSGVVVCVSCRLLHTCDLWVRFPLEYLIAIVIDSK